MNRTTRIKTTALNPHVICVLCGGYFINATTITECLHSFCRTCITRYLQTSKYCPVCDVMVHKTRPLDYIRSDKTLQDLVYKLVPGLYKSEMKRRRDYYAELEPPEVPQAPSEDRGDEFHDRIIYTEDEKMSLSLELCADGIPFKTPTNVHGHSGPDNIKIKDVRYLQCPAAFSVGNLKKFIRMKFDLKQKYEMDIFHTTEPLPDYYSLMDIAYIYTWTRRTPLRLYYTVFERRLSAKTPGRMFNIHSTSLPPTQNNTQHITKKKGKKNTCPVEPIEITNKHSNTSQSTVKTKKKSRKRKLPDGPGDISPDLELDKDLDEATDNGKTCANGKRKRPNKLKVKKAPKKLLSIVDDESVKEAMSESEEQFAKLTIDSPVDLPRAKIGAINGALAGAITGAIENNEVDRVEHELGDTENSDVPTITVMDTVDQIIHSVSRLLPESDRKGIKDASDDRSNRATSVGLQGDDHMSEKENLLSVRTDGLSKSTSTQSSPVSVNLTLFQPLNAVTNDAENDNEIGNENSDKLYEFKGDETVSNKPGKNEKRGRPPGSKNKVKPKQTAEVINKMCTVEANSNGTTVSSNSNLVGGITDTPKKANISETPKKTKKISDGKTPAKRVKAESHKQKSVDESDKPPKVSSKGKKTTDNSVEISGAVVGEEKVRAKRKYVRKAKPGNDSDAAKTPKKRAKLTANASTEHNSDTLGDQTNATTTSSLNDTHSAGADSNRNTCNGNIDANSENSGVANSDDGVNNGDGDVHCDANDSKTNGASSNGAVSGKSEQISVESDNDSRTPKACQNSDKEAANELNGHTDHSQHSGTNSLVQPTTPLYGETPNVNESNQGLPCSPNMDSTSTKASSNVTVNKSNGTSCDRGTNSAESNGNHVQTQSSNGALEKPMRNIVDARQKETFPNNLTPPGGYIAFDRNLAVVSGLRHDVPVVSHFPFRHANPGNSPPNAYLTGFPVPGVNAHAHFNHGHMMNIANGYSGSGHPQCEQNFDQPLDLTNNMSKEEYTKGKIFKTKMLKKNYPKTDSFQNAKEKANGQNGVNTFQH